MSQSSITSILIQKLGHEIPEIRVRALQNLLSKFELGISMDSEIPRSMELLEKLINWFEMGPLDQEKYVLQLLQKLLNSPTGISLIKYKGPKSLIQDLKSIKLKLSSNLHKNLDDIIEHVQNIDDKFDIVPPLVSDLPLSYRSGDSVPFQMSTTSKSLPSFSNRNYENIEKRSTSPVEVLKESQSSQRQGILKSSLILENNAEQFKMGTQEKQIRFSDPVKTQEIQISDSTGSSQSLSSRKMDYQQVDSQRSSSTGSTVSKRISSPNISIPSQPQNILINYFPLQILTNSDLQIIKSLENSLNFENLDDDNNKPQEILNSLKFLRDVALKDFPPEIFLQEPGILNILYSLIETGVSTRLSSATFHSFYEISEKLFERIKILSDPGLRENFNKLNNPEKIYQNVPFSNKNISLIDSLPNEPSTIYKNRISVPFFAIKTLNHTLNYIFDKRHLFENPTVKKKLIPPLNMALKLINSLKDLLILSLKPSLFQEQFFDENEKILFESLKTLFENFAQVLDQLKIMVQINEGEFLERLTQISILICVLKILRALVPNREIKKIPKNLRNSLGGVLMDTAFSKLFPEYHEILIEICTDFSKDELQKYSNVKKITFAMTSAVKILRYENLFAEKIGFQDTLHLILNSLPALEYHRNFKIIDIFFNICLKIPNDQLVAIQNVLCEICISLLGHFDLHIAKLTYTKIHHLIKNRLGLNYVRRSEKSTFSEKFGPRISKNADFEKSNGEKLSEMSPNGSNETQNSKNLVLETEKDFFNSLSVNSEIFQGPSYDSSKERFKVISQTETSSDLLFLVQPKILTEILTNGLQNSDLDIKTMSEDLLLLILKGKNFVSDSVWEIYMSNLVQIFPLLCCFGNYDTLLGRTVIKMFDPDVSVTLKIPIIESVKSNLRFLYNPNNNLRNEAVGRLLWLLTIDKNYEVMVPKVKTLQNEDLKNTFVFETPIDLTKSRNFQSFYQVSNLNQVIDLLKTPGVDFDLFKSALNQISVIISDSNAQRYFLENGGLDIILRTLHDNLLEKNYFDHKREILKSCITILKNLTLQNTLLREELSLNPDLIYAILRTLILIQDKFTKIDLTTLLTLILFSNLIKSSVKGLTFPELLKTTLKWPFSCNFYLFKNGAKNISDSKIDINNEINPNILKTLRVHWNIEYFGGISEIFKNINKNNSYEPDFQFDSNLNLIETDFYNLKSTSIEFSINEVLFKIQNATTHFEVLEGLQLLEGYLNLFLNLNLAPPKNYLCNKILNLPWKPSLQRFVSAPYSNCGDRDVLKVILKVLGLFLNLGHLDAFLEISKPLFGDIKNILYDDEINVDFFKFLTHFVQWGGISKISFKYVLETIRENLRGPGAQFYDLNFLNSVLNCLKELTFCEGWSKSYGKSASEIFSGLISGLWEILTVFHCDSKTNLFSFMGVNVTRTTLTCLNQILVEMQLVKKSFDQLWFDELNFSYDKISNLLKSRDIFIKNGALALLSGLVMTSRGATIIVMESHRNIWNVALEIFMDQNESSVLRENAALLLTNLSSHANITLKSEFNLPLAHAAVNFQADLQPNDTLFYLLEEFNFYENLNTILLQFFGDCQKNEKCLGPMSAQDHVSHFENLNNFKSKIGYILPNLIKNSALFINNLICLNSEKVCDALHEHQLVRSYFRCLHFPPLIEKSNKSSLLYSDVMEMNAVICLLLTRCTTFSEKCQIMCLNTKDCLTVLIGLLNPEIYDYDQPNNLILRNKLFSEIFLLLSILLHSENCLKNSEITQILFNSKNNHFIKALILSLDQSKNLQLQKNGLKFIINLLSPKTKQLDPNEKIKFEKFFDTKFPKSEENKFRLDAFFDDIVQKIQKSSTDISKMESLTFGALLTVELINLYKIEYFENQPKDFKKKELILGALSSLFFASKSAKICAVNENFIKEIKGNLMGLNLELSLHSLESLRISEKKKVNPLLKELDITLSMLNNFSFNSDNIKKNLVSNADICDQLHKFFIWFTLDRNILTNAMCLINTLTSGSEKACLSLILTTSNFGSGPKKTPTSMSLLNVICDTVTKEINNISKVRDLTIFELGIQILGNVCCVSECRSILAKQMYLFQSFTRIHPQVTKHQKPWDQIERLLLNFLKTFTFYPEGQVIIGRKTELFDLLLTLANCSKTQQHRLLALQVLRHSAFHQTNRIILLSSMEFLNLLKSKLNNGSWEEKHSIITTISALVANNQRSKNLIRCAQIDAILEDLIKQSRLKSDQDFYNENCEKVLEEAVYLLKLLRDGICSE